MYIKLEASFYMKLNYILFFFYFYRGYENKRKKSPLKLIYIFICLSTLHISSVSLLILDIRPFFQITSSAVRPLTNIPHCCTYLPWDFFIPNVVDQPFSASTKRIVGLLSHYLNNYLSLRYLFSS
jgi:hypothetical protein